MRGQSDARKVQDCVRMIISVTKRFIFVANTKTASTSIEHVLLPHADLIRTGDPRRKHVRLADVYGHYPYLFNNPNHKPDRFFTFGVMRDPLDWISSWFRYRKGNQVEAPLPADMDFESFWQQKDWNIQMADGRPHLQSRMFCNDDGDLIADSILRYETLEQDFGEIANVMNLPRKLPRHNVSAIGAHDVVPPHLVDEVRAFYVKDYEVLSNIAAINARGLQRLNDTRPGKRRNVPAG